MGRMGSDIWEKWVRWVEKQNTLIRVGLELDDPLHHLRWGLCPERRLPTERLVERTPERPGVARHARPPAPDQLGGEVRRRALEPAVIRRAVSRRATGGVSRRATGGGGGVSRGACHWRSAGQWLRLRSRRGNCRRGNCRRS